MDVNVLREELPALFYYFVALDHVKKKKRAAGEICDDFLVGTKVEVRYSVWLHKKRRVKKRNIGDKEW